jgi:rare lipoprotein A (peptidoglycan hydrolase)
MLFASGLAGAQTVPTDPTEDGTTTAATAAKRADSKVKLRVQRHVMAGNEAKVTGRVWPRGKRWVSVKVGGKKVRTVKTRRDGAFRVLWKAPRPGVFKAKALVQGNKRAKRARSRNGTIHAYRASHASYYGPGFFGGTTACGKTLTPSTIGVANKSLPCGTKVVFRYRGRTVKAPVIDRGPYAAGRDWDLTSALKQKLGFGSTGTVLSTK